MKIAVAMSGGVDSSAAAALLKEQGHELVGFTMQLWNQRRNINVDEHGDPLPSRCCSLDDVYDARRVAERLGFPFYVLNLERDFEESVVEPFIQSYLSGETPMEGAWDWSDSASVFRLNCSNSRLGTARSMAAKSA